MSEIELLDWTCKTINANSDELVPLIDMRKAVSEIKKLPPLPQNAYKILQLMHDPLADAEKLAGIIETDPILSAQIIRWASSPLYGYKGKVTTVKNAICRVLGYDFVLNLALGLAAIGPLKVSKTGPIGTKSYLTQALAGMRLMKLLNDHLPQDRKISEQSINISALLHNIGFLLLAHLFFKNYSLLEKLIVANPLLSVYRIETLAYGVEHTMIGAWLMKAWDMPKEIIDVVYHHHNPNYEGEHADLNRLVLISDSMLGDLGIGDARNQLLEEDVVNKLGLTPEQCSACLDTIKLETPEIDNAVSTIIGF